MPIYRATLPGIKGTLLLRAPSAAQAKDLIVELKALTSDELSDALEAGEKVYKQGDPIIPPTPEQKLQAKANEGATKPLTPKDPPVDDLPADKGKGAAAKE